MTRGKEPPPRGPTAPADNGQKQFFFNAQSQVFRGKQPDASRSQGPAGLAKPAPSNSPIDLNSGKPSLPPFGANLPGRYVLSDYTVQNRRGDSPRWYPPAEGQHYDRSTDTTRDWIWEHDLRPQVPTFDILAHVRKTRAAIEAAAKSASDAKPDRAEKLKALDNSFAVASEKFKQANKDRAQASQAFDQANKDRFKAAQAVDQVHKDRRQVWNQGNPTSIPRRELHREVLRAQRFLDLHHEVLTLKERVLELEGISDARKEIDHDSAKDLRRMSMRIDQLEKIVLEKEESVSGGGKTKSSDKAAQQEKVPALTPDTITAGLRKDGRELFEYEDEASDDYRLGGARVSGSSLDIPGLRLHYEDLELEELKKKCAALQEHSLRAWPSKAPKAPPDNTPATTTYEGVQFHPTIRENPNFPAPSIPTSGEPMFKEIDQPGFVSTFRGPAGAPGLRRHYGGGFPGGYGENRDDTPRPVFTRRFDWSSNANASGIHPPNLPPAQASHFRQPIVTEEADENFVDAVEDLPTSRAPLMNADSRDAILRRIWDNEKAASHSDFDIVERESGSTYDRRIKFGIHDPFAARWAHAFGPSPTVDEGGNTDFD